MSYRVELERFGAVVTVETVAEVRDLLEAIYPRLEMTLRPPALDKLLGEAAPSTLPTTRVTRARRESSGPRPSQAAANLGRRKRANPSADEVTRIERGLLALLKDGPRKLDDLAAAAGLGRTTALEYLKRLAADGKAHQEGRGPATRWAVGPKEEP